jgi:hypothetical protein
VWRSRVDARGSSRDARAAAKRANEGIAMVTTAAGGVEH